MPMTFDASIHVAELLTLAGSALAIFKGGIGLRDAVRDMTGAVDRLDEKMMDHEERIRNLEFGDRRSGGERRRHD